MKKRIALLLALVLLLALAACEGAGTAEGTSTPQARVVRYGISSAWDALMPYNSTSGSNYSRIVYDKIYDRLAYVHADGSLSPRAAKRWESADDGYAVVFYLDERAAFHDGTPVTAQHWVATLQLVTNPQCPALGRAAFSGLSGTGEDGALRPGAALGAEAVDAHTLKLTFQTPTTPEDFLNAKNREFYVLPTHLLEGVPSAEVMSLPLWSAPIGSGPCRFEGEIIGSQLTLAANEGYQLGAPGFDTLVMTVMDKSNLLTALIAGDLDYYAFGGNATPEDAQVARDAGLTVAAGTVPTTFYELMLNNETLGDAALRVGIDWALDKTLLCRQSAGDQGAATGSAILPGSAYAPYGAPPRAQNLALAQASLAQGGYDGRTYTLACTAPRAGLAALVQQQLAQAGMHVNIETVDSATLFSGMADGSYDMALASHTPGALPLWFVESRLKENNNIFHLPDLAPYTQCIGAIKGEANPEKRNTLVAELEARLEAERPFLPLFFLTPLHVQSPTVAGIDYASSSFSNENVWAWTKGAPSP